MVVLERNEAQEITTAANDNPMKQTQNVLMLLNQSLDSLLQVSIDVEIAFK